jgi:hypothetical protein
MLDYIRNRARDERPVVVAINILVAFASGKGDFFGRLMSEP